MESAVLRGLVEAARRPWAGTSRAFGLMEGFSCDPVHSEGVSWFMAGERVILYT